MGKAKPKTRLLNWAKKVISSFGGEIFTKKDVIESWDEIASARVKPTDHEMTGLLRNLLAQGFIERVDDGKKTAAFSGSTYYLTQWREVQLDGKHSD